MLSGRADGRALRMPSSACRARMSRLSASAAASRAVKAAGREASEAKRPDVFAIWAYSARQPSSLSISIRRMRSSRRSRRRRSRCCSTNLEMNFVQRPPIISPLPGLRRAIVHEQIVSQGSLAAIASRRPPSGSAMTCVAPSRGQAETCLPAPVALRLLNATTIEDLTMHPLARSFRLSMLRSRSYRHADWSCR